PDLELGHTVHAVEFWLEGGNRHAGERIRGDRAVSPGAGPAAAVVRQGPWRRLAAVAGDRAPAVPGRCGRVRASSRAVHGIVPVLPRHRARLSPVPGSAHAARGPAGGILSCRPRGAGWPAALVARAVA